MKTSPVLSRVAGRRETLQKTLDFDEFTVDDAEEVRVLLLRSKEYPVKYSLSTMLHFHSMPLFQQLSVVAREKRNEKTGEKGKIVGVAGTALDNRGMANVMMLAVDDQHRRIGLGKSHAAVYGWFVDTAQSQSSSICLTYTPHRAQRLLICRTGFSISGIIQNI